VSYLNYASQRRIEQCTLQLDMRLSKIIRPMKDDCSPCSPRNQKQGFGFRARHGFPASGGADRDRTDDLRLAKPALSQLSYSPWWLVGLGRFELPTSRLSGVRSNQLSYRPGRALGTCRNAKNEQSPETDPSKLNSDDEQNSYPKKNLFLPTAGED
jgi:hypothetical protein